MLYDVMEHVINERMKNTCDHRNYYISYYIPPPNMCNSFRLRNNINLEEAIVKKLTHQHRHDTLATTVQV